MPPEKDPAVETLRGIAIVLVVAFHLIPLSISEGVYAPDRSWCHYLHHSFRYLPMPLFTAIAGFVYAMRPVEPGNLAAFLRGKVRRILIPLFTVSTLQFLVKAVAVGVNRPVVIQDIWKIYIYPFDQFWFLQAIFLIFVTGALLDYVGLGRTLGLWLACLAGASALCLCVPVLTPVFGFRGYLYLMPFFILGCGLNRFASSLDKRPLVWGCAACFAFAMAVEQLAWFGLIPFDDMDVRVWKLLCHGLSATFLLFHFKRPLRVLAWLGSFSYAIYLFHAFATGGSRILLGSFGVSSFTVQFAVGLAAGLAFPICVETLLLKSPLLRRVFLGLR